MVSTWGPPGSCGPQMAPCWAHEPCYQGWSNITWYFMQHYIDSGITYITVFPLRKTSHISPIRLSCAVSVVRIFDKFDCNALYNDDNPQCHQLIYQEISNVLYYMYVLMRTICKASFHQELFHAMLRWLSHICITIKRITIANCQQYKITSAELQTQLWNTRHWYEKHAARADSK